MGLARFDPALYERQFLKHPQITQIDGDYDVVAVQDSYLPGSRGVRSGFCSAIPIILSDGTRMLISSASICAICGPPRFLNYLLSFTTDRYY
jgi:hypothetical protein